MPAEKDKYSLTTQMICVFIILAKIPFTIWWKAFCCALIWNWYAPSWNAPLVTWHMIVGPSMLIGIGFMGIKPEGKSLWDKENDIVETLIKAIGMDIGFALLILVAYICRP